jgi:hypothetical protein
LAFHPDYAARLKSQSAGVEGEASGETEMPLKAAA